MWIRISFDKKKGSISWLIFELGNLNDSSDIKQGHSSEYTQEV